QEPTLGVATGSLQLPLEQAELAPATHERAIVPPLDALRGSDGDESISRHSLRLSLQFERLDGLDLHRVANQSVGGVAEQDFVRRRGLLEARSRVDGIPRYDPVA